MKKVTKNNYRQYYKNYFGVEFGIEFDIHHIDQNRDNNDISNLLLLPKKTHNLFHKFDSMFKMYEFDEFNSFNLLTSRVFTILNKDDSYSLYKDVYYWNDLKTQALEELKRAEMYKSKVVPFYQHYISNYN